MWKYFPADVTIYFTVRDFHQKCAHQLNILQINSSRFSMSVPCSYYKNSAQNINFSLTNAAFPVSLKDIRFTVHLAFIHCLGIVLLKGSHHTADWCELYSSGLAVRHLIWFQIKFVVHSKYWQILLTSAESSTQLLHLFFGCF